MNESPASARSQARAVQYRGRELTPCVTHVYPEFERVCQLEVTRQYAFTPVDCREWHRRTLARILGAIGQGEHLGVYRISHGEFIMALGVRRHVSDVASLTSLAKDAVRAALRWAGLQPAFRSGSVENSYELFTASELKRARRLYIDSLRAISRDGILAIALQDTPGYEAYVSDYVAWLESENIALDDSNYATLYSIYALFGGSDLDRLLRDRHVLIVTSFPGEKRAALERNLLARGARAVQFYEVSASKAMFDVLDLTHIRHPVDVTFVGAGVGAASILEQLRPLKSVAIDAGFAIDVLANPDLAWNRPFFVTDDRLDPDRVKFLSPTQLLELTSGSPRSNG